MRIFIRGSGRYSNKPYLEEVLSKIHSMTAITVVDVNSEHRSDTALLAGEWAINNGATLSNGTAKLSNRRIGLANSVELSITAFKPDIVLIFQAGDLSHASSSEARVAAEISEILKIKLLVAKDPLPLDRKYVIDDISEAVSDFYRARSIRNFYR